MLRMITAIFCVSLCMDFAPYTTHGRKQRGLPKMTRRKSKTKRKKKKKITLKYRRRHPSQKKAPLGARRTTTGGTQKWTETHGAGVAPIRPVAACSTPPSMCVCNDDEGTNHHSKLNKPPEPEPRVMRAHFGEVLLLERHKKSSSSEL